MGKPLYIIEEHHEVFSAWHHARIWEKGPAELIHVDAHPDMSLLCAGIIPGADAGGEEMAGFVHNCLDIQTFITPAVFNGWFNRVTWVKPGVQKPAGSDTWIWKTKGRDDRLFMGKNMPKAGVGKKFMYQWVGFGAGIGTGLAHQCSFGTGPAALDIDLDFFMSSDGPCSGTIEITKDEYKRYRSDVLHYLRLHFGSRVRIEEKDGRYFLILTPEDIVHRAGIRTVEKKEAAGTIEAFGAWLNQNPIDADIISICRSRVSGFTPKRQWEFLEQTLIRILTSIYGSLCIIDGAAFKKNHIKDLK